MDHALCVPSVVYHRDLKFVPPCFASLNLSPEKIQEIRNFLLRTNGRFIWWRIYFTLWSHRTIFQCFGRFVLSLSSIQSAEVLQSCRHGRWVDLCRLMPATIFTIQCTLFILMLVLFTLLGDLHTGDWDFLWVIMYKRRERWGGRRDRKICNVLEHPIIGKTKILWVKLIFGSKSSFKRWNKRKINGRLSFPFHTLQLLFLSQIVHLRRVFVRIKSEQSFWRRNLDPVIRNRCGGCARMRKNVCKINTEKKIKTIKTTPIRHMGWRFNRVQFVDGLKLFHNHYFSPREK